jgi:hypothetical protein
MAVGGVATIVLCSLVSLFAIGFGIAALTDGATGPGLILLLIGLAGLGFGITQGGRQLRNAQRQFPSSDGREPLSDPAPQVPGSESRGPGT